GRLLFQYHDVLRRRSDLGDDVVAVDIGRGLAVHVLIGAGVLPGPASAVPIVFAPHAGGVDHRDALGVGLVDQRLEIGHGNPGVLAAGIAPALDRFEYRHGALVAERVIHVDDQERGTFAESAARAIARRLEHRFVALGEELVPNGL